MRTLLRVALARSCALVADAYRSTQHRKLRLTCAISQRFRFNSREINLLGGDAIQRR